MYVYVYVYDQTLKNIFSSSRISYTRMSNPVESIKFYDFGQRMENFNVAPIPPI